MKSKIRKTLVQKLNDALVTEAARLTWREIRLPVVLGKAMSARSHQTQVTFCEF